MTEAGVTVLGLSVFNDPSFGICVEASLDVADDEKPVREVLGRFPFKFRMASFENTES